MAPGDILALVVFQSHAGSIESGPSGPFLFAFPTVSIPRWFD